ncbi:MAG: hypothetical protein A2170_05390 [Deltaproteobacteria bacterium RBG_13_53_10]|nr:MAG: hypothetical protein A2170_05390 [Deltaproteobacteria bacterium RBG_13_53_10]
MIKRLIPGLLILSTLLVYFFSGSGALFERNRLPLPFGFTYCLPQAKDYPCGKIQSVNPDAIRDVLGARLRGSLLVLNSWIYSPKRRSLRSFLSGNGDLELHFNNTRPLPSSQSIYVLRLNKGYNRIMIRFQAPADKIPQLTFSLTDEVPFYSYVIPSRPPSEILSRVLSVLDRWKLASFVLAFLFLMFQLGRVSFPIKAGTFMASDNGLFYGLFRGFCFFLVFGPLVCYLNHALGLSFPDSILLLGGLMGSLGIFLVSFIRKERETLRNGRSLIVLSLIVIFTFLQIVFVSGSFLPPPKLSSDLPAHLRMMQHYQDFGDILRSENNAIYPQGIHAFVVRLADSLNLPLQESLIVFLVVVSILIYFMVYLLSQELFGRTHYAYFFLALSLSYFRFIYDRFFQVYQFPSMVAILFFLLSLYFFLKRDLVLSSISLASAVITYPYYTFFFVWVILFQSMEWLKEPHKTAWQKVRRSLLYFSIPLFSAFVYFQIYWRHGFSQQSEGFQAWFKINPFISMQIINALLLLGGVYILLKRGKNRRARRVVLGMVIGFMVYYIPYHFFSWSSTYYFMKSMQYVILLGIPLEIIALAYILQKFERKAWAKYAILSGAAGIYILRILGSTRL